MSCAPWDLRNRTVAEMVYTIHQSNILAEPFCLQRDNCLLPTIKAEVRTPKAIIEHFKGKWNRLYIQFLLAKPVEKLSL